MREEEREGKMEAELADNDMKTDVSEARKATFYRRFYLLRMLRRHPEILEEEMCSTFGMNRS